MNKIKQIKAKILKNHLLMLPITFQLPIPLIIISNFRYITSQFQSKDQSVSTDIFNWRIDCRNLLTLTQSDEQSSLIKKYIWISHFHNAYF